MQPQTKQKQSWLFIVATFKAASGEIYPVLAQRKTMSRAVRTANSLKRRCNNVRILTRDEWENQGRPGQLTFDFGQMGYQQVISPARS